MLFYVGDKFKIFLKLIFYLKGIAKEGTYITSNGSDSMLNIHVIFKEYLYNQSYNNAIIPK